MEISPAHSSIAQAHFACVDAFLGLLNAALAHTPEQCALNVKAIHDAFDKYRLWSGNLGAMHSGEQWKKSLDYRLREASFYKVQVLRLLEDLKNSVETALSIIDNTSTQLDEYSENKSDILDTGASATDDSPWEVSSDSEDGHAIEKHVRYPAAVSSSPDAFIVTDSSPRQEATSAIDLVDFIISCLWKLPIRRPAPLDRMKERATAETSYYQPFDIMHVKNKFPNIDERVAMRLGKMISRRRQLMRYRKTHTYSVQGKHLRTRRPVIEATSDQGHEGTEIAPSFVASTHHTYDTKATTLKLDAREQISAGPSNLYAPSISPSTSSAGSEQSDGEIPIVIPNRPKGDSGDALEQFICPYCLTAQSIQTDRRWKKHVIADLQPYVCTYSECSLNDYVFENQDEWFQHEAQLHRCEWFCNVDTHEPFNDALNFLEHMKVSHEDVLPGDQLSALQHMFQHPTRSQVGVCPLCRNPSKKLKTHLARHLKQLALFAIPQTDYMADSDTEDAQSDVAHRSRYAMSTTQHSSVDSDNSSDKLSQAAEVTTFQAPQNEPSQENENLDDPFAPPLLEGIEDAQGTSWDYVTPKFQEARAAMYGSHTPELAVPQRGSANKEPPLQEQEPKVGNPAKYGADMTVMNPYYQQRPLCGASIGAYRGEHLPPVSLGGIILVDGEPYGLTVHHMLDAPSDDESDYEEVETNQPEADLSADVDYKDHSIPSPYLQNHETDNFRQSNPPPVPTDDESEDGEANNSKIVRSTDIDDNEQSVPPYYLESEEIGNSLQSGPPSPDASTLSNFELSDSDIDESISDSIMGEDVPADAKGDIPGIPPGEGEHIIITQPAIDDVDDDFFPSEEDRDEDHLSSHAFGHVYASSGIRRWKRNGIVHEIDWALIKVDPARLQLYNVVQGGRRYSPESKPEDPPPLEEPVSRRHYTQEEDEYPMEVAPADSLGGLNVHCFGRTTGLQGGLIGPSMTAVKIYRRKTYSKSWHVAGGFGVGGDTGAWVIEDVTGRVCGIVLAWDERNHIAYIMPMQIVLEDIKRTLGASEVCLPRFKAGQAPQAQSASSFTSKSLNTERDYKGAFERFEIDEGVGIDKGLSKDRRLDITERIMPRLQRAKVEDKSDEY